MGTNRAIHLNSALFHSTGFKFIHSDDEPKAKGMPDRAGQQNKFGIAINGRKYCVFAISSVTWELHRKKPGVRFLCEVPKSEAGVCRERSMGGRGAVVTPMDFAKEQHQPHHGHAADGHDLEHIQVRIHRRLLLHGAV